VRDSARTPGFEGPLWFRPITCVNICWRRPREAFDVLPIRALETKGEALLPNPAGSAAAGAPSEVHGARIPRRR
jgi:hypothetical protein